ncbi:MAG: hypothetical protein PHO67_07740 [Candidatus Omnitrophica bacterium]|nr:hypothetical protein [Candidatus Omnitrophota bacterium]
MPVYFDSGTTHILRMEVLNPTSRSWRYRIVITSGSNLIDDKVIDIDAGATKRLSTEVQMPEVTETTTVNFKAHVYEVSSTPNYDMGVKADIDVIVMNIPVGSEYNAAAYFDDQQGDSYLFESGTEHKITVKFTNPYDTAHQFYISGLLGSFSAIEEWGFFTVAAGQTITKEAIILMGDTPQVVGPVTFSIHCTTKGIPGVDVATGSLEIVESQTVQDGTIEMIPLQMSVGQGRALEFDVKITNPTNKKWSYQYTAWIQDANGKSVGGITSTLGVGPYSSETARYKVSVIYPSMIYPPVGIAYLKTSFMGAWQNHGTINVTSASEPGATATLTNYQWTDIERYMFKATIKNTSSIQKRFYLYGYIYDGTDLQTYGILGTLDLAAGQSGAVENQLMPYSVGSYNVKVKVITYEEGTWVVSELETFSAGTVNISG